MITFRQAVTGVRDAGVGAYDEGVWVPGGTTILSIVASVQPLRADEMLTLPEGRRSGQAFKLYTDTQLLTANQSNQQNADILTIDGEDYEIVSVAPHQCGIRSHYKAVAVRIL